MLLLRFSLVTLPVVNDEVYCNYFNVISQAVLAFRRNYQQILAPIYIYTHTHIR